MEIRKNSQLRHDPLINPVRIQINIPRETLEALKQVASDLETTYSEVVRALINDFLKGNGRHNK